MALATLTGHAVPLLLGTVEHTYVWSSDGYKWGCFGRGGPNMLHHPPNSRQICAGQGDSAIADCLSEPQSPNSHAGLIYGLTGVCHQASNRILHPATEFVDDAKGYGVSSLAYGAYGAPWFGGGQKWRRMLSNCYPPNPGPLGGGTGSSDPTDSERDVDPAKLEYFDSVNRIYEEAAESEEDDIATLNRELELEISYRLGEVSASTKETLISSQTTFLQERTPIGTAVIRREIDGETYANNINSVLSVILRDVVGSIGNEVFGQFFNFEVAEVPRLLEVDYVLVIPDIARDFYAQFDENLGEL